MKKCVRCKNFKDETEFNKNLCRKDHLQTICKACSRKNSTKYYNKDKPTHYQRVKDRRNELYEWYRSIKESLGGCVKCGENTIICLDFHHQDPKEKEYNIVTMANRGFSKENILKEIKKCVILCSNCHRKLHAGLLIL